MPVAEISTNPAAPKKEVVLRGREKKMRKKRKMTRKKPENEKTAEDSSSTDSNAEEQKPPTKVRQNPTQLLPKSIMKKAAPPTQIAVSNTIVPPTQKITETSVPQETVRQTSVGDLRKKFEIV